MELTKKRAITLHRRMWRWIGLKTLKEKRCVNKSEWFAKFGGDVDVRDNCYCCEYAKQFRLACRFCPIDWGGLNCTQDKYCFSEGLFILWGQAIYSQNYEAAAKFALQIAELPERED